MLEVLNHRVDWNHDVGGDDAEEKVEEWCEHFVYEAVDPCCWREGLKVRDLDGTLFVVVVVVVGVVLVVRCHGSLMERMVAMVDVGLCRDCVAMIRVLEFDRAGILVETVQQ